jgi:hypothetical protein
MSGSVVLSHGHSVFGLERKDGPLIQRAELNSSTVIPRLKSSAGFSSDGTYRHELGLQLSWISATRTPTNGLNEVDSEHNQLSTMVESDQNVTLEGFNLDSSTMV